MKNNHFVPLLFVTLLLAGLVVLVSSLMPFAELGFSDSVSSYPKWLSAVSESMATFYKPFTPIGNDLVKSLLNKGVSANLGDYAYVVFLGVAMTLAAIAIMIVGRQDAEEKTYIPVKK